MDSSKLGRGSYVSMIISFLDSCGLLFSYKIFFCNFIFQLLKSAGVKDSLSDIFTKYLDLGADSKIKSTLQKVQLSIYYQIEMHPVPSKVHVL